MRLSHHRCARFSCALQQPDELRHNMLLDVAYVGNRADDLLLFANYNQAVPNNAGTIPLQDRRSNACYSDITDAFNGGKSRDQALQLNRTNFRAPNGNRSAAAGGTITATSDPRQLQLGFKLW
jgi:hypothetical protein